MHIVIVSDYGYVSGGAAQVAVKSACALAERGVRVTFACALGPPSPELNRPGITVHCLGASNIWAVRQRWRAAAQGIWNAAASQWLKTLLNGCDPGETVVHMHQWTKAFSPSVLAVATTCGLPFVVTLHDYFLSCPNGAYFVYPKQRPCSVKPMSAACWATDCDARSVTHKAVRLLRQIATGAAVRRRSHPLHVIHVSRRAADVDPAEPGDRGRRPTHHGRAQPRRGVCRARHGGKRLRGAGQGRRPGRGAADRDG